MLLSKSVVFMVAAGILSTSTQSEDVRVQHDVNEEFILASSCSDLADGEHQLKLLDGDVEDYPIVTLTCSNGYTILDPSKDSNLESYFDTYMKFHHSVAGPTNDVHANWEGWYKADDGSSNYLISPDCNTCDESHTRQLYTNEDGSHKTAYMMTGTMFGCFWNLKGEHNFDEDYDNYQCYYTSGTVNEIGESIRLPLTDYSKEDEWDNSGVCAFSVRDSSRVTKPRVSHDACTADWISLTTAGWGQYGKKDVYHLKPSIGTDGEFCVCTKPSTNEYYSVSGVEMAQYVSAHGNEVISKSKFETNKNDISIENNVVNREAIPVSEIIHELYQNDFESGTYRILESGTYKIMQDITFDFNADYDSPNSDTAWWPHSDQSEEYPGAAGFHDSYFLGFWAGITIEADDVVLDLNGKELKMSNVFYHQQRWFTAIALQSQYFLPGQGIGFFGADPHFSENVVIKDGTIGLSSHHGIHGHFNKNVLISNVHVENFETHGIQFNGFDGVTISNCEIGPTSEQAYFKGEYGHARTLLPRFQLVADENPTRQIHFYGRENPTTMQEIVDELQKQTDMAYNHVVNDVEYDDDDESWQSAKYLFVDNTNLPNGAAMYGIFLNTYGASVLTYNLYTSFYSNDATVEDTVIHGLRHSMNEYMRMSYPESGNLFMNPLHAPFDATQILQDTSNFDSGNIHYKGSVLTDACLAMSKFSNNWSYLQAQLLMDSLMLDWAQEDGDQSLMDKMQVGCNIDVMIHSGKGINGLRIDGVDGVTVSNLEVYDITEETPLGRTDCGEYTGFNGQDTCQGACGGHFRQTYPMQIGFSGTMVHGINVNAAKNVIVKDVNIHDLESKHGPVFGISVWPAVDIKFEGTIVTSFLEAGTSVKEHSLAYDSRPNAAPEACGIRVYQEYSVNEFTYTASINQDDVDSMTTKCVSSHASCFNEDGVHTHLGDFSEETECLFKSQATKTGMQSKIEPIVKHKSLTGSSETNYFNYGLLAIAVALFAYFGLKCMAKYNLIPNRTIAKTFNINDEQDSLISANDEAARYTVL